MDTVEECRRDIRQLWQLELPCVAEVIDCVDITEKNTDVVEVVALPSYIQEQGKRVIVVIVIPMALIDDPPPYMWKKNMVLIIAENPDAQGGRFGQPNFQTPAFAIRSAPGARCETTRKLVATELRMLHPRALTSKLNVIDVRELPFDTTLFLTRLKKVHYSSGLTVTLPQAYFKGRIPHIDTQNDVHGIASFPVKHLHLARLVLPNGWLKFYGFD